MMGKAAVVEIDYYKKASSFYEKGKYSNAIRCCNRAINKNPQHFMAYNILGIIARRQEKNGDALFFFKKSIEIEPAYWEGYNNLGETYFEIKMYDEAIACFKIAIQHNPNYAEAYYNLANTMQNKGEYDNALMLYQKAVEIKPAYQKAYHNMGNIFGSEGFVDKALFCYRRAVEASEESICTEAHINLSYMVLYAEGAESWKKILLSFIQNVTFPTFQKGDILTSLAIANWIAGDTKNCLRDLSDAKEMLRHHNEYGNFKSAITYNNFLKGLILWHENNPEDKIKANKSLHFIGDSHSLTCSNKHISVASDIYKCNTHFIRGCKMWHIVDEKNSSIKVAFERELESLSAGDIVVLTIGEIDCRYDEGLFYRHRKYATDLEFEVNKLLDGYFKIICNLIKTKNIIPVVWCVPAPHKEVIISICNSFNKALFMRFIEYFNEQLVIRAKEYGIVYSDNYSITVTKDKLSDTETHLDKFHLKPSTFKRAIEIALQ